MLSIIKERKAGIEALDFTGYENLKRQPNRSPAILHIRITPKYIKLIGKTISY